MESEEFPTVVLNGEKARKRSKNLNKREREKLLRYKQKSPPIIPNCIHRNQKGSFKCNTIKANDAMKFSKTFYTSNKKLDQDQFILKYTSGVIPNRKGPNTLKITVVSVEYYVRKSNKNIVRVCQKAFCGILGIGKDRAIRIAKAHLQTGKCPTEKRGGNRIGLRNEAKKAAIIDFIKKFKTIEIHYCRSKTAKRQYLPSELNINKMFEMFLQEVSSELSINRCFFRNIFNSNFNIGFKTPSADLCSKCIMLLEKIKLETDEKKKQSFIVERVVHKRRAKAFFQKLQEERNDLLSISFDCQKNMVLPKVADQAAYCCRQFYMYNFGVVIGSSRSALTKNNVFLYPWTEDRYCKGSIQIASAVNHCLRTVDLGEKKCVRLVADGCGGQNKNSIMIGMCAYWLLKESPQHVDKIELIFPISGHSFIPPDRIFAQIEKVVKNRQTIIKPEEYMDIYKSFGTVFVLGDPDCPVKDWKSETLSILRPPGSWHFKFSETKRFILTKSGNGPILVRAYIYILEVAYKSDIGVERSITKKRKKNSKMNPSIIEPGIQVAPAKIKDVSNLLKKHFGAEWSEIDQLQFYRTVMDSDLNNFDRSPNENEPICEHQVEFDGLRV